MLALPVFALVGYGAFLLATFGWRTLEARRTTGQSSWRRPISRADAIGEMACVAGCSLSLLAPPLAMGSSRFTLGIVPLAVQGVVSVAGLGLGMALAIWAQHHLAGEWRAGVEASASLVTTGPFARIRNPFYLGCSLASAAVLVAVPSPVALAGFALHIAASEIIVRAVEEPTLSRAHGDNFARYIQRTGRFLPRLRISPWCLSRRRGGAPLSAGVDAGV